MKEQKPKSVSRRDFMGNSAKVLAGFMILPRHVLGGTSLSGIKYTAPSDIISLGLIGAGKQGGILSNYFLKTEQIRFTAISEVYQAKAKKTLDSIKANYAKKYPIRSI